jgi:hypothetical protein
MTQHAELIRRLETNAALMPSDAAVALEYKAAAEALKEQAVEVERLRKDAERLDFMESAPEGSVRMDSNEFCPRYIYWGKSDYYKEARRNDAGNFCGPTLRAVLDAAMKEKGRP